MKKIKFKIHPIIIVSLIAMFCMGFILGMVLQQQYFIKAGYKIARGLEGTTFNIEVDINETLIVDRTIDKMNEFGVFNLTNSSEKETVEGEE